MNGIINGMMNGIGVIIEISQLTNQPSIEWDMNHFPLILNTLPLYGPEYVHINSGFTTRINGIIIEIICHN